MLVVALAVCLNAGPAAQYAEVVKLAELGKTQEVCAQSATRANVVKKLAAVVKRDAKWLASAETDAAFDGVRDTLEYQRLRGLDPGNEADVPELLARLSFVSEKRDAFGPKTSLQLHADGTADYHRVVSSQCDVIQHPQQGRWTRDGRTVTVTLAKPVENVTSFTARFGVDGRLIIDSSCRSVVRIHCGSGAVVGCGRRRPPESRRGVCREPSGEEPAARVAVVDCDADAFRAEESR